LLFALKKFKQNPEPIRTEVQATVGRNDQGRMRVQRIDVTLNLGCPAAQLEHLDRVVAQFEDFCTVTQSVAQGLEVVTRVQDSQGLVVKG
jgi:organic hydroperoxide reductase OsmC/OhrA